MKYKITNTTRLYALLFFILLLTAIPFVAWGQSFTPLVGIPGLDASSSIGDYVNALYILSISIAAFLAVIKLIIAGVKYMTSDIVTSKEDAKKDIKGALFGLLIVIGAVLILSTINSQLTGFNILEPGPGSGIGGNGSTIPTKTFSAYGKCYFGTLSIWSGEECREWCLNDMNGTLGENTGSTLTCNFELEEEILEDGEIRRPCFDLIIFDGNTDATTCKSDCEDDLNGVFNIDKLTCTYTPTITLGEVETTSDPETVEQSCTVSSLFRDTNVNMTLCLDDCTSKGGAFEQDGNDSGTCRYPTPVEPQAVQCEVKSDANENPIRIGEATSVAECEQKCRNFANSDVTFQFVSFDPRPDDSGGTCRFLAP